MAPVFRSSASTAASRLSGIVAASLVAATYAVAPTPAAAIEGLPPHCAKAGNELAQLKCGTAHYRQKRLDAEARSADAKARGAAADVRAAAADARGAAADARSAASQARSVAAENESVCLNLIMKDIENNGSKTANLLEPPKKGEACSVARSLKLTAG